MNKTLKYLLAGLLFTTTLFAQESTVKVNHEGKEFTMLKHAWKAQWITHPGESTLDFGVFVFRKHFDLPAVPDSFKVYVSADNRYRLFVNGTYVSQGPASGDINNYRYETLDIAPQLKAGKNVIAAEVVNFGEYRKASQQTFQTAFILQSDRNCPVEINTGGTPWIVAKNYGYEQIPFVSDSLRGYYAAGPCEHIIGDKFLWGWEEPDFDDSGFLKPKAATVEFAVGRGFLYGSTWYLVPRVIPPMEETKQRFASVARAEGLKADDSFIKGTGTLTIPANTKATILLDHGHHTIGQPEMFFSKGDGSRIKITYTEALYDKDWKKGHRDAIEGKHIMGYYDIVEPDGGDNRMFKPLAQRTYRYVQIDIETGEQPLEINDYYGVYVAYPFEEKAYFRSGDDTLSMIWDASWLTLRNSAVESFIDPYYEQLQYIGDTRIEALVAISVSGDDKLMRKAIDLFDKSRLPMGLTQSRYPSYIVQIIPTYSLLWVDMIHDYHMYRDDDEFLKNYVTGMKAVLDWWERKIGGKGMPTGMEWWNFTDWAKGYPNGIPPGADDGYSAAVALQYVYALQNASEMFAEWGMNEDAEHFSELAKSVTEATVKWCYNKDRGMFAETPEQKLYSQHTNILAILTDAVPEDEQKALMQKILKDTYLIQTTIYFKFYLFEALEKAGLGELYTGLLDNWKNQLKMGLTTFAETDVEPRSECHAWSASPDYHLTKIVAGIRPDAPNFKKVLISPNLSSLNNVEAAMPHPKGSIEVDLKKRKNKLTGTVTLPNGIPGTFVWKGNVMELHPGTNEINVKAK